MDYSARILLISAIDTSVIWTLVLMIVLLAVSSFFSMSETVFSTVNTIRLKTFIDDGKKGAKKALWIAEKFDLTLTTILVGNNLANIALATVSVSFFTRIFGNYPLLVNLSSTFVMTTIILIFGEILPKSFAKRNPEHISLMISSFFFYTIKVMKPITFVFLKIKEKFIKENKDPGHSVTEDELETIIDTMEEQGSIDEDSAEMLQSVLDLSDKKVYEIMTPRVDMIGVNVDDDIETIKKTFFEHQFSRLPVFENTRDNVVGVLYERDFMTKLIKGQKVNVKKLMKEPMFVSKSMRVDTLIELLQREASHIAVVSDEYGGTSGIVTMEDALEELVGEIYDEHDEVIGEFIQQLKPNKYGINAEIDLEDLFEELDLGNPPVSHYATLGGWLYDMYEEIPEVDESYSYIQEIQSYDAEEEHSKKLLLKFVVKDMKERRISYVNLTIEEIIEE